MEDKNIVCKLINIIYCVDKKVYEILCEVNKIVFFLRKEKPRTCFQRNIVIYFYPPPQVVSRS